MKSNMKKHTALNHIAEKPFFTSFVANCDCENQLEGAYSAAPYRKEAIF